MNILCMILASTCYELWTEYTLGKKTWWNQQEGVPSPISRWRSVALPVNHQCYSTLHWRQSQCKITKKWSAVAILATVLLNSFVFLINVFLIIYWYLKAKHCQFHYGYEIVSSFNIFKSHSVPALTFPVNWRGWHSLINVSFQRYIGGGSTLT